MQGISRQLAWHCHSYESAFPFYPDVGTVTAAPDRVESRDKARTCPPRRKRAPRRRTESDDHIPGTPERYRRAMHQSCVKHQPFPRLSPWIVRQSDMPAWPAFVESAVHYYSDYRPAVTASPMVKCSRIRAAKDECGPAGRGAAGPRVDEIESPAMAKQAKQPCAWVKTPMQWLADESFDRVFRLLRWDWWTKARTQSSVAGPCSAAHSMNWRHWERKRNSTSRYKKSLQGEDRLFRMKPHIALSMGTGIRTTVW